MRLLGMNLNWLFLIFGLVGLVVTAVLPQQLQTSLSAEAGWIELLSALCLAITSLIVCFLRPLRVWAHVSLLAFLLAEREFDARVLSEGSYIRIAIEWIGDGLLHNRGVVAVLGFWLIFGLLRYTLPLMWGAFRRTPEVLMVLCALILLVLVSQVIDMIVKSQVNTVFSLSTLSLWEEMLELYFAVSILVLAVIGIRRQVACCTFYGK
jgi:hypothetical protein